MEIKITEKLREEYPDIHLGTLIIRNVINKEFDERLEREKRVLEKHIRENYKNPEKLKRVIQYNRFYNQFDETFPIEYQIRSILREKEISSDLCLVEAMFMNELKNCCLTAGHDLDALKGDLVLDLAEGSEAYTKINDEEQSIKKGDIILKDELGVIASVVFGPDNRTKIISISQNIIYMTYFIYPVIRPEMISIMGHLAKYLRICEGAHAQIEKVKIY
jgi:DNA/RNA-binding domain of Phe-tRNA-synthetase-like protein